MIREKWVRQDLYEKVWQFPLRKLAVEYSISSSKISQSHAAIFEAMTTMSLHTMSVTEI
jgi:hypothetical protein